MQGTAEEGALFHEIGLIALFVLMVILFCCNFGIIGPVGDAVSGFLFGVFGFTAYAAPVLLFLAVAFRFANEGNPNAVRKMIAGFVLFLMLGAVCDLIVKNSAGMTEYNIKTIYENCRDAKNGGGVLGGSVSFLLQHYLGALGTVLVVLLCSVISLILLTERSLLKSVREGGSRMRELSREDAERRREIAEQRREDAERRKEDARLRRQEQEE
ncbi:MAG: DNA translocase FtsK 4TM domain-containing protein, partial [Acetatifactor sp.]|nr:DNA translocase FtsK 4TM domain-containing protein [Acetatifactor sp.]